MDCGLNLARRCRIAKGKLLGTHSHVAYLEIWLVRPGTCLVRKYMYKYTLVLVTADLLHMRTACLFQILFPFNSGTAAFK